MRQEDLQRVRPGFEDPVIGSQAVFRQALQALAMPGRPLELSAAAQLPAPGHGAAALLLLALLDSDCTLWLSPSLAGSDAQAWLQFHTGCRCVQDPGQAQFLWLAAGDAWPALAEMNAGSDEYPDQSATCVMEVAELLTEAGQGWLLRGPGIDGQLNLTVNGLPLDFDQQWANNQASFPRGVDLFLATPTQLVGLPRSTQLQANETVEA
jgi:alpha-D-ribose 1-methylphosphonate 5-triphosphate synthase subunit PhnH